MAAFDASSSSSQTEKSKTALKAYVKQALVISNAQQDYYARFRACASWCVDGCEMRAATVLLTIHRLLATVQSLKSSDDHVSHQQLVNLLDAISSNVSLLHHQRHKTLLVELLEHRLWHYTPVGIVRICHIPSTTSYTSTSTTGNPPCHT